MGFKYHALTKSTDTETTIKLNRVNYNCNALQCGSYIILKPM